jgi:cytochrome b561
MEAGLGEAQAAMVASKTSIAVDRIGRLIPDLFVSRAPALTPGVENTVHSPNRAAGQTHMYLRNSSLRFGAVAQTFHWVIVALIITQFTLAWIADDLHGMQKLAMLTRHKSFGITIMGLAVLRLLWRLLNPTPVMPAQIPRWQRIAAHAAHAALYVLLFAVPLVGWLMSSAKNYTVSWFNLVTLPNLVGPDETLFNLFRETHEILALTLLGIAIVHALAALKHEFIDKDNVLRRMLPLRLRNEPGTANVATRTDTGSLHKGSA